MKRHVPKLFLISLLAIFACSTSAKKSAPSLEGYWIADEADYLGDEQPLDYQMMAVFSGASVQLYEINNNLKQLNGHLQPYQLNDNFLTAEKTENVESPWESQITSLDETSLVMGGFKSGSIEIDEVRFNRISYTDSKTYFDTYTSNFTAELNPEATLKTDISALKSSDLQGFWEFFAVTDDDAIYTKNQLVPSSGDRVPDSTFIIHFKNDELIIFDESSNYPSTYRPFEIAGSYIVADAVTFEGQSFSATKIKLMSANVDETPHFLSVEDLVTYSFDTDVFVAITDKVAEARLADNARYLDHFSVEAKISESELSGFWLLDGFEYQQKSYDLGETTDDNKSVADTQNILHFKDNTFRQYFNTGSSTESYKNYTINGSRITIPNLRSAVDSSNDSVITIKSHLAVTGGGRMTIKRFVTPYFVEFETYRKLTTAEASILLEDNTSFNEE
ncbi:hypothetical protein N9D31_03155 [Oligoflexaceae bacterium]|nr:hypothetical protein [Oligoflexaceae bacterium]